jgi:uncharacterized protein with HEPN domain
MSTRDWQIYLQDIISAGEEILSFTNDMDFKDFFQDTRTIRAVSLNFIIIGEAANSIPDAVQERYSDVPWHLMRAMRNRLVHVYYEVDPKLMWDTIKNDLPPLISRLERLIKE